jgi:hypothetical protein
VIPDETAHAMRSRLEGCPKCGKTIDRLTEPDGRRYACGGCWTFFIYEEPMMFFSGYDQITLGPDGDTN